MTGRVGFAVAGLDSWKWQMARRTCWVENTQHACAWMGRMPRRAVRLNPHHTWDSALAFAFPATQVEDPTDERTLWRRQTGAAAPAVTEGTERRRRADSMRPLTAESLEPSGANSQSEKRRAARTITPPAVVAPHSSAESLAILARHAVPQAGGQQATRMPVHRRKAGSSLPPRLETTAEWRDRLADHAARRLNRSLSHVRLAPRGRNVEAFGAALAAILEQGVGGPAAPPSLLATLVQGAGHASSDIAAPRKPGSRQDRHDTPGNTGSHEPPHPTDEIGHADRDARHALLASTAGRVPFGAAGPADDDERPLRPIGLSSPLSAPAPDVPLSVPPPTTRSINRVGPPLATPSLPPLLPDVVTQPPAFGLSAPAMRPATRAEDAAAAPEDLSELADKVRRILRDDARRHGILLA